MSVHSGNPAPDTGVDCRYENINYLHLPVWNDLPVHSGNPATLSVSGDDLPVWDARPRSRDASH